MAHYNLSEHSPDGDEPKPDCPVAALWYRHSRLARLFRKQTGTTPHDFREQKGG
jgi:hypothetical protein